MWAQIIAAIGGAIIGGVANGVSTAKAIDAKVQAYKDAAKEVREAANKYSGENAYRQQTAEGKDLMTDAGNLAGSELAAERLQNLNPGVTGVGAMANAYKNAGISANAANQAANQGFSAGTNNAANTLNSKYNVATTRANQLMKQADIDYGVTQQRNQELAGAASDIMKTGNQIFAKNGRSVKE